MSLTKDSEFWFEDGTIILVARHIQFRVYRGPLSQHPSVFCDMFSLPRPEDVVPSGLSSLIVVDRNNDCPVVHLDDSPEDVRHMLRAVVAGGAFM